MKKSGKRVKKQAEQLIKGRLGQRRSRGACRLVHDYGVRGRQLPPYAAFKQIRSGSTNLPFE